ALPPDACRSGRQDREQRARLGVELRQAEHERQRRHEQDPAADAEQPGEYACDQSQHRRQRERPHQTSSQIAMPARSAANPSESVRAWMRCCRPVPSTAPTAAGRPTTAAAPGFSSPWNAELSAPTSALGPIAASDVPSAVRSLKWATRISSGRTTIPPPTPKRALKTPAI